MVYVIGIVSAVLIVGAVLIVVLTDMLRKSEYDLKATQDYLNSKTKEVEELKEMLGGEPSQDTAREDGLREAGN